MVSQQLSTSHADPFLLLLCVVMVQHVEACPSPLLCASTTTSPRASASASASACLSVCLCLCLCLSLSLSLSLVSDYPFRDVIQEVLMHFC